MRYNNIKNNEDSSLDIENIKNNKSQKSKLHSKYEWYSSFLVAVCIVILFFTFFIKVVNVDGDSMEQTLYDNDKVIISNLFYTPKTGDVIITSRGENYDSPLVKRVIATENQSLKIDFENETIIVDGVVIDEPYKYTKMSEGNNEIPEIIPKGKVFVLGDHRDVSLDSRDKKVGLIDYDDILGKAHYVIFPISNFKNLSLKK